MKKSLYTIITLTLLTLFATTIFPSSFVQAKVINAPPVYDPLKPWTITFNGAVVSDEDNLKKIYVLSADNKKIEISYKLSTDLTKVIVIPKKYYSFMEEYILVIPKGFKSKEGEITTEDTTMTFRTEGEVITDISATTNPLYTAISVRGSDEIAKVEVHSSRLPAAQMLKNIGTHFSKGILGLKTGDLLTIRVYDKNNSLLETQYIYVK